MQSLSLKRSFLYALIGSVGLSALLGILAIQIGDFGEFEVRVLLTTLTISGASLCGLSCGAALETGRARLLPLLGIGLAAVAALLVILGIWVEFDSEAYWKITATTAIFAVACSHMALLSLARLAGKYGWALWAAHFAVFSVAFVVTLMIWGEVDEVPMFRLLGVAAILDGVVTIVIPILHRLSRADLSLDSLPAGPNLADVDREIEQLRSRLRELEQFRQQLASDRRSAEPAVSDQKGTSSSCRSNAPAETGSGTGPSR